MSAGVTLLRRRGEVYAIRRLQVEATKLRAQSRKLYHEDPEVIAAYLTLAYWLDDAATTLRRVMDERREADGEEP